MEAREELKQKILTSLSRFGSLSDGAEYALAEVMNGYEISQRDLGMTVYDGGANDHMVKAFIVAKKIAGRTDRTLEQYFNSINYALGIIGKTFNEVTKEDIQIFFARKMRDGVSKRTIDHYRRCLSSFYTWLEREEIIKSNPMKKLDGIKYRVEKEKALSDLEVEKIRSACKDSREKCVVEVLLSTGCRVSELVQIRVEDIKAEEVRILGKGEKWRTVYLNAKAIMSIETYIKERKGSNPYLFYNGEENKLGAGTIEKMIRELGKRAGLKKVHPHRFRRTCATNALRHGMPIEIVSMMLGHESIQTTQIYLDLTEENVREAHRKYVV